MSESVTINGDFNGTLNVGNDSQQKPVEEFTAEVFWRGEVYQMQFQLTEHGLPAKWELARRLQEQYPGAMVHNIYPSTRNPTPLTPSNIKKITY